MKMAIVIFGVLAVVLLFVVNIWEDFWVEVRNPNKCPKCKRKDFDRDWIYCSQCGNMKDYRLVISQSLPKK